MQTSELIARLEAATADDAGLMRRAFLALYPEPAPDCEPAWRPENPKQPIYHAWKTRQMRFVRLLQAEAYESAALTLVPEGWGWADIEIAPKAAEALLNNQRRQVRGNAPTPALAICIAALRASNEGEGA